MQLSGTTEGAEGLKGDSGDKAEELDGFDSAGGPSTTKETWGWMTNTLDWTSGDEDDLELDGTSSE